jgi:hypothetical protein
MKSIKFTLLGILTLALAFFISCNDDNGEKLSGQMKFVTNTSGTIEANHMYLLTFSGLTGEQDIPNGVQIGANDEKVVDFLRVGEKLNVYLSNIPDECPNVSSASSTGTQFASGGTPNDPQHPEAQYQSIIIIPGDGSQGELTFTIACN